MAKRCTEEMRAIIKEEFIYGIVDEQGQRQFPTLQHLAKRHDVVQSSLYRWASKEAWQRHKDHYHSKLEQELEQERIKSLVEENKRLDQNSIRIAQAMLNRVGTRLRQAMDDEQSGSDRPGMTASELRELSNVAANAQKVGKLALGEAQEISKVAADVTTPESFQRVMETLDELAETRASRHGHTLQ